MLMTLRVFKRLCACVRSFKQTRGVASLISDSNDERELTLNARMPKYMQRNGDVRRAMGCAVGDYGGVSAGIAKVGRGQPSSKQTPALMAKASVLIENNRIRLYKNNK